MHNTHQIEEVPKWAKSILNNVYEALSKLEIHGDSSNIKRNLIRILDEFEEQGLIIENPINQDYNETRTDLEATIVGAETDNLYVTEVIKPIIRFTNGTVSKVVQKGIVVVESKEK